ncbi:hypothetical protein EV182_003140 [Spiromyces aspiralis]|uniref:Uncharacterized protein n=1 Tax=Spiromyces aspiralis TaxID=68401 RepID=A0ACC1HFU2_9FUNG|nr:hypothetical protein EV182_003140 [Spiromyces aspiralis]
MGQKSLTVAGDPRRAGAQGGARQGQYPFLQARLPAPPSIARRSHRYGEKAGDYDDDYDDDDEDDDSLDSFIVDDEEEEEEAAAVTRDGRRGKKSGYTSPSAITAEIHRLFGYNRSRYVDDDDDDDDMETSAYDQLREERRSAWIAREEDLREEMLEMERERVLRKKRKLRRTT